MGTSWGKTKIQHSHHPAKEKKPGPLGACCLTHWLQEMFLPICIICHFWPSLMEGHEQWAYIWKYIEGCVIWHYGPTLFLTWGTTGNDCFLLSKGTSHSPGSWTANTAVCIFSNVILVHSCHWCESFVAPQCLWPHSCWVDTMSVPVFGSSVVLLKLQLFCTKKLCCNFGKVLDFWNRNTRTSGYGQYSFAQIWELLGY